jgi:hypothetical protein
MIQITRTQKVQWATGEFCSKFRRKDLRNTLWCQIGDLRLLEARCDYVLFVDYGAINGDAMRLSSCPYVPIHRDCSLYATPIVWRTTRGWFCWLNWFVWFSMHCLSSGVRHRLMRISNTVSWLMFDCHGGWLRQNDAQGWQDWGGGHSGTLTGEKYWLVINKENYLLKTVPEVQSLCKK